MKYGRCIECNQEYILDTNFYNGFCCFECEQQYYQKHISENLFIHKCVICNTTFISNIPRKYCTYECEHNDTDITQHKCFQKICMECGEIFYTTDMNKKYCSMKCNTIKVQRDAMLKDLQQNFDKYHQISLRVLPNNDHIHKLYERDGVYAEKESMFFNPNNVKVVCDFCGKIFLMQKSKSNKDKNFCSPECFHSSRQTFNESVCLNCNQTYAVRSIEIKYSQFCSSDCEQEYYDKIASGKIQLLPSKNKYICINCGHEFYNIRNNSIKFCSNNCKKQFFNKSKLTIKICKECGNEFSSYRDNQQFCSIRCSSKYAMKHNENVQKNSIENNSNRGWNKGLTVQNNEMIQYMHNKKVKTITQHVTEGKIHFYFQGKHLTDEHKQHCAEGQARALREGRRNFGLTKFIHGYFDDVGHIVRSSWELNFARILHLLNRNYEYEKQSFTLSSGKIYTPDFYLYKNDTFYEIKGAWHPDSLKKFKMFLQEYPNIKIHLITRYEYRRIVQKFYKHINYAGSINEIKYKPLRNKSNLVYTIRKQINNN